MATKISACLLLAPLMFFQFQNHKSYDCRNYILKNDFKNLIVRICNDSLFYFEKDYDMGPYKDTCKIKISGENMIIIKKLREEFPYEKISYGINKGSIFLKYKTSSGKIKKIKVPLSE